MSSTYKTKQGDMWDGIAKKLYDDEAGMNVLMEANEAHIGVVVFHAGVVLTVPDYTKPTTTTLPPWRR